MRLEHDANVNRWPAFTAGVHDGNIAIKQENAELRLVTEPSPVLPMMIRF
jgi:hypothetical protein